MRLGGVAVGVGSTGIAVGGTGIGVGGTDVGVCGIGVEVGSQLGKNMGGRSSILSLSSEKKRHEPNKTVANISQTARKLRLICRSGP